MKKLTGYYVLSFLLLGIIIFCYFYKWRTVTFYGDDLASFISFSELKTLPEKINQSITMGKFRPVYGVAYASFIKLFQTNTLYYYLLNILIQTLNTFLLARILFLLFGSYWQAILFSLFYGISRFTYFNICQLLNGGVLEGLAITFFLLSLFSIIKGLINNDALPSDRYKAIMWSIVYANLSLYTHERYIILLPFIVFVVLLYPTLRTLSIKQKAIICIAAFACVVANVAIKKYVFNVPFFVGTGGTNVDFSFAQAFSFFIDGILSILQINAGPEYLVGIPFGALPIPGKILVLVTALSLLGLAGYFIVRSIKATIILFISRVVDESVLKQKPDMPTYATLSFFLFGLLLMVLVPSVITIRLEQRWLQASFIVFIIILAIVLNNIRLQNNTLKTALTIAFALIFLWNDYYYLSEGMHNLYLTSAHDLASQFKEAIDKQAIREQTTTLYIHENQRDVNSENAMIWTLGGGSIFRIYQHHSKNIVFVDSVYERSHSATDTTFLHFNPGKDQLVLIKNGVTDITAEYQKDSLRTFKFE